MAQNLFYNTNSTSMLAVTAESSWIIFSVENIILLEQRRKPVAYLLVWYV